MTITEIELRSGEKRRQLEAALKTDILSGRIRPGERLPTYEDMMESGTISRATFHYVIKRLKEDCYIKSIERQGVFVAKELPGLRRVGLIFETHEHGNLFLSKLAKEALLLNRGDQYDIHIFRGEGPGKSGARMLRELREQLARKTLAGLCFTYDPVDPDLLALLARNDEVPYLLMDYYGGHDRALVLCLNTQGCAERVADHFVAAGRRRIAVLSLEEQPLTTQFVEAAASRGLTVPEEWVLLVGKLSVKHAGNLAKLLWSLPAERRPEGLYITDDNLLTAVQAGLVQAGAKVPEELLVLSHDNFPDTDNAILPITKIGFDVRAILRESVDMLRARRRGEEVAHRELPGRFDHEISC